MLYVGLDLGQAADYSALALVEEPIYCPPMGGWVSSSALTRDLIEMYPRVRRNWERQAPGKCPLWLRHLSRYPLRTSYPDIVADIVRRLGTKARDDAELVVDGTGVGAAVVDMFRYSDLPCPLYPIIITAGVKQDGNHVPKRDLIGAVQVAIQTRRLESSLNTKEVETFFSEMQSYAIKLTDTGHDTYNAREGKHDDLVLAVALAVHRHSRLHIGE